MLRQEMERFNGLLELRASFGYNPSLILDRKPFVFFTFPAANGIAGTRWYYGFLSFGFSLIKVFDHLLEFQT